MKSMRGEVHKLYRQISYARREQQQSISVNKYNPPFKRTNKTGDGLVINATNGTGAAIPQYSCVKLYSAANADDPPVAMYPNMDVDEAEDSLYGSVINQPEAGDHVVVQVTGKMLFVIASGGEENYIMVGELIYPLTENGATTGAVGNKAGGTEDLIDIPIGRSLTDEDNLTQLIEVVPVSGSAGEDEDLDILVCIMASTANLSLSGLDAIDGVSPVVDDYILVKDQSTPSENGVYSAALEAWTKVGQPGAAIIRKGTSNGRLTYVLTAENTYSRTYAAVASTS